MYSISHIRNIVFFLVGMIIIYGIIPYSSPLFNTDYSQIITDENGEYLRVFLNDSDQWCLPPTNEIEIPEKLKKAIITFEDKFFYWHLGVNPLSIVSALYKNLSEQKIISGASTITMQVARLRSKNPRTFINKFIEILSAIKIELNYSKEEILKLYLDHAPFGGNIIGYRTACLKYFNKMPEDLSWADAATLAVLPNAPGLVAPNRDNQKLEKKRNRLLQKLFECNEISELTLMSALKEPILSNIFPFKAIAPHLSDKVAYENKDKKIARTTINIELQQLAEHITFQYSKSLKNEGIKNCSAIVLDTKSGEVKAYVGSADYFDFNSQGMVDGVAAKRSSASTLKPFLYALSIDEGLILPQTLMHDIPTYFEDFSPRNSDLKYRGIVRAKDALTSSLNIPAVRLLNSYGVFSFYTFLKSAGLTTLFRSSEDYGLPLIIGGAEVSLFELAMLYHGLANNGRFKKPYYLKKDSIRNNTQSNQLISSGSSYLTLEMLKDLKRPGIEHYWKQFQNQMSIAWKTGTSYGGKDAWAIGVTPRWTVGVWVGNFDGETNANISGVSSAGPLLFELFNNLPQMDNRDWFEKYDSYFKTVQLCKETGFLRGPYCDEIENSDIPENMFPLKICPFHKNIYIDPHNEYAVCSNCWNGQYEEKHILRFPSNVVYYLQKNGQTTPNIPSHNRNCNSRFDDNPIKILYPPKNSKILLPRDFNGNLQELILKVAHTESVDNIFWYINEKYLGTTEKKHEKSVVLDYGWHKLFVVDMNGFSDEVNFFINRIN